MNMTNWPRYLVAGVLLLPSVAFAQTAAMPSKPDFTAMKYFTGSWTCTTTKSTNLKRVGTTSKWVNAIDPTGYWLVLANETGKTYLTYDAKTSRWVSQYLGNTGDYGTQTSPGWAGNTLVVKDAVNSGGDPLGTLTMTKISESEYTAHYAAAMPKGGYSDEASCVKTAS